MQNQTSMINSKKPFTYQQIQSQRIEMDPNDQNEMQYRQIQMIGGGMNPQMMNPVDHQMMFQED